MGEQGGNSRDFILRIFFSNNSNHKNINNMFHSTNLKFNEELVSRQLGSTAFIIVHHSGVSTPHDIYDMHQWHLNRGWAGIGYHYVIDENGEVFGGRPWNSVGAHVYGHNRDSIGVCFIGDFNTQTMNEKQETAGVKLLAMLSIAYPEAKLCRHSDFSAKNCPGKNFPFERISQRVEQVKENIFNRPSSIGA